MLRTASTIALLLLLTLPVPAFADELRIPILVGQTGASATFGKNETDAYILAGEEWNARGGVNGKTVILTLEDTQTKSPGIIAGFQRFALDKPPVLVGPTWLDGFQAVIPLARKHNILLVTPSAARETFTAENRDWPITFYHNTTLEIGKLLETVRQRGYTRPAMVYEREPFAELLRRLVAESGTALSAELGVQTGEVDFGAQLVRLKQKRPDALLIFLWNQKSLLTLLQQLRVQMPELPLMTVHDGAGWLTSPAFKAVIPALTYTSFITADSSFGERFKARFGYEPMLTASNAYDALNILLEAYRNGCNQPEQFRKFLTEREHSTVTFGRFRFAEDGSVPSKIEVIEYRAATSGSD